MYACVYHDVHTSTHSHIHTHTHTQGEWVRGKQHGSGAFFGKDGYVYDGNWSNGKASGGNMHKKKGFDQGKVYTRYDVGSDKGQEDVIQGVYVCMYVCVCVCVCMWIWFQE